LPFALPARLLLVSLFCLVTACAQNAPVASLSATPLPEYTAVSEHVWARSEGALPDDAKPLGPGSSLNDYEYLIGPDDGLEITVFQIEELSGLRKVDSRGEIRMPLIDSVKIAGLSVGQAEEKLESAYSADYLQDPQINIEIVNYASQQVTILGAVFKPGVYPLTTQTTLLQVIAMAGGPNRVANEQGVVVFRKEAGGNVYGYQVNLDEIVAGIKTDPEVAAGDRVVVPESGAASFWRSFSIGVPGFGGYRQY